MTRPTREQIEAARTIVARLDSETSHLPDSVRDALRTLLAATAAPTEDLAEEAAAAANEDTRHCTCVSDAADALEVAARDVLTEYTDGTRWSSYVRGFFAGARREGAR